MQTNTTIDVEQYINDCINEYKDSESGNGLFTSKDGMFWSESFIRRMEKYEDEYLNFLSFYYSIQWSKEKIYFPFEAGDNSIIVENQRNARISFKELTQGYKDGILEIISQIAPEVRFSDVKKMLKNI